MLKKITVSKDMLYFILFFSSALESVDLNGPSHQIIYEQQNIFEKSHAVYQSDQQEIHHEIVVQDMQPEIVMEEGTEIPMQHGEGVSKIIYAIRGAVILIERGGGHMLPSFSCTPPKLFKKKNFSRAFSFRNAFLVFL